MFNVPIIFILFMEYENILPTYLHIRMYFNLNLLYSLKTVMSVLLLDLCCLYQIWIMTWTHQSIYYTMNWKNNRIHPMIKSNIYMDYKQV